MRQGGQLVRVFDKLLKQFSATAHKVRRNPTGKGVHHLRVTTRRLIALLDLVPNLAESRKAKGARRRLKKVLKWTSPLRDLHVQGQKSLRMHQADLQKFHHTLQRKEKQEFRSVGKHLKRVESGGFRKKMEIAREEMEIVQKRFNRPALTREVARLLDIPKSSFERSLKRIGAAREDRLHQMRIALKKLRYAAEAAEPLLGNSVVEHVTAMKSAQQLIGDARDAAILAAELEHWAAKEGRQHSVSHALAHLRTEREAQLRKVRHLLPNLRAIAEQAPHTEPPIVIEKTVAIRRKAGAVAKHPV